MEGYISPDDAAAPGGKDTRDLTSPKQPMFAATSGEMLPNTPSIAGSRLLNDDFDSQDPRRETFSNEEALVHPSNGDGLESVSVYKPRHNSAVLDMSNPTYSVPGADFLLATEYIVGGQVYDAGEVLDGTAFPELQAERNKRITEILTDIHRQKTSPEPFVPKILHRGRSSIGMTNDSWIREENRRLWKEELFDKHFISSTDPNQPVRVKISRLVMLDGRVYKKNYPMKPNMVELFIDSLIRETSRAESSRRLSRPLPSTATSDSSFAPTKRSHEPASYLASRSPAAEDIDDHVSVLTNGSQHRDRRDEGSPAIMPQTADPKDKTKPMPSPLQLHGSEWILRVEMRTTKLDRTSLPQPLDVSAFHNHSVVEEGTRIDKKTPFLKGPSNKYPFKTVSVRSYRIMLTDLVAHWCRGPTADQNVYLFACWESTFQDDFVRRWRAQCSAALSHPHRQDGRYINTYQQYNAAQFGSLSAISLVYLVYICLLPLRKGREGETHECMLPAVREVVNDELSFLVERYSSYMKNGILDFLSNYNIVTEAIFLAMSEIEYAIYVYEWWMNAGWFDVLPTGESVNRSQCFTNVLDAALAKFSTPQFDLYGLWHHWDVKDIFLKVRPRHVSTYLAAKRMKQRAQQTYFDPLHAHLPTLLNLPKPPYSVREHQSRTEDSNDHAHRKRPANSPRTFRPFTPTNRSPGDKTRLTNISADMGSLDDVGDEVISEGDVTGHLVESAQHSASPPPSTVADLNSPNVIARLAALVSSHMKMEAAGLSATTPAKSPYTSPSSSPWSPGATPTKATDKAPLDKRACYNVLVTGKCNRPDSECMYSHDSKIVNEAKTQCMARWKSGQKTPFNNLSTLDRFFPRQEGLDDFTGYSDESRDSVYEYFQSNADTAANTVF